MTIPVQGDGCALMGRTGRFEKLVGCMTEVLDVPLTVKMRTGIYESKSTAHNLIPRLRDWGVALVTVCTGFLWDMEILE